MAATRTSAVLNSSDARIVDFSVGNDRACILLSAGPSSARRRDAPKAGLPQVRSNGGLAAVHCATAALTWGLALRSRLFECRRRDRISSERARTRVAAAFKLSPFAKLARSRGYTENPLILGQYEHAVLLAFRVSV
jgi:hypothetical protein